MQLRSPTNFDAVTLSKQQYLPNVSGSMVATIAILPGNTTWGLALSVPGFTLIGNDEFLTCQRGLLQKYRQKKRFS